MPKVPNRGPSVSFHDEPPTAQSRSKYKDIIQRAKSRDRERPGDLQNTPRFDEVNTSWDTPTRPTQISEKTAAGLHAVAEATAAAAEQAEDPYELDEDATPARSISAANIDETDVDEDLSEDDKLRAAVEGRIRESIDIGQYLMNGEATQSVPIIPKKLVVTFRTVTDLEESYVDTELSRDGEMTTRSFLRKSNEWALAFHIAEVNGMKWPSTLDADGSVNDKSIQRRLGHVRKLSSPVFSLITKNLYWFLERVQTSLTVEALGNG